MTSRFELPGDIAARMKMLAEMHRQCGTAESEQDTLTEIGRPETGGCTVASETAE